MGRRSAIGSRCARSGTVPIDGIEYELGVKHGLDERPLRRARSDAEGRLEVELEFETLPYPLCLTARPLLAGYQRTLVCSRVVDEPGERSAVAVRLVPGTSILGRARDAGGAPHVGRAFLVQGAPGAWRRIDDDFIDGRGFFEFHLPRWDEGYSVIAGCGGYGSAVAELPAPGPAQVVEVDLQLAGEGVLGGRVVDPVGRPIEGRRVTAVVAEHGADANYDTQLRYMRDDGVISTSAVTGAEGEFHLAGLRPGHYVVLGFDGVHLTGDDSIELVDRDHRLVVSVRDAAGVPVRALSAGRPLYADWPPGEEAFGPSPKQLRQAPRVPKRHDTSSPDHGMGEAQKRCKLPTLTALSARRRTCSSLCC